MGGRQPTSPSEATNKESKRPCPDEQSGWLRVDTVHQGGQDKVNGVYHINLVDEMTQFVFVASVGRISEHFLLPLLEDLLAAFPFVIHGLHADNGSEFINHQLVRLLENLRVEHFTKSRPRHRNDNALMESKNGLVVHKRLGWASRVGDQDYM